MTNCASSRKALFKRADEISLLALCVHGCFLHSTHSWQEIEVTFPRDTKMWHQTSQHNQRMLILLPLDALPTFLLKTKLYLILKLIEVYFAMEQTCGGLLDLIYRSQSCGWHQNARWPQQFTKRSIFFQLIIHGAKMLLGWPKCHFILPNKLACPHFKYILLITTRGLVSLRIWWWKFMRLRRILGEASPKNTWAHFCLWFGLHIRKLPA